MKAPETPLEGEAVNRLRSVLGRLIEVSELNLDELEPATRRLVGEAVDVLRETSRAGARHTLQTSHEAPAPGSPLEAED